MQFTDAVTVAGKRRRDDGYLVADARIARTGIQNYLGSEVGSRIWRWFASISQDPRCSAMKPCEALPTVR
ncbi:DUF2213 domain-containing protein [Phyllobacterium trifolii]|uniref:DUF2213 domain-containing protein n=1 Tax=Phyllobacterium trifolii TaxID=300193 RepID=UPI0028A6DB0C|nr:DUF2213 domain-containing protein [Phyllobacterium trifolii]